MSCLIRPLWVALFDTDALDSSYLGKVIIITDINTHTLNTIQMITKNF